VSILTSLFSAVTHLYVVEIMLRTERPGQLVGLMREHLFEGRHGQVYLWLVTLLTVGVAIPALTSYVIGGGHIIGAFFGKSDVMGSLVFLVPGVAVVWMGLGAIGASQRAFSLLMGLALIVLTLASVSHPAFDAGRLTRFSVGPLAAALPVGIYTSMSQSIVPEVVRGLAHRPELIPKAVKWGLGINLAFLIVFPVAIFGLQDPSEITQVVTISWGKALGQTIYTAVNVFALFALITSFWGSAGAALGNVVEILRFKSEWDRKSRLVAFTITILPSCAIVVTRRFGFVDMIQAAGSIGGVVLAVLPMFVLARARHRSARVPEYRVGALFALPVRLAVFAFYVGVLVYAAIRF
jgi:amino acid permease